MRKEHEAYIQDFERYLRSVGMAENTVKAYGSDTAQFLKFLEDRGIDIQNVSHGVLLQFLEQLTDKRLRSSTKHRMMEAVKALYRAMQRNGLLRENPFTGFQDMPRTEDGKARVLTEAEYRRLRDLVRSSRRKSSVRDYAMLEMALQTGLRRAEICALTLDDVMFSSRSTVGHVEVRKGKGGKGRTVTLNEAAEKALKEYLAVRPKDTEHREIFLNNRLKPCDPVIISVIFKRYMRMAGMDDASFHSLRHTFATHNLNKGANIIVIQEALGHKRITTTQKYTHLLREMMDSQLSKNIL